ncbi:hypothetical protein [Lactobacillus gallinarum]|uniref:hypothetical protein n=1 Tax=Lactobacillus gallinarum TaxID=52242 RepID=UPI0024B98FDB|nr:hypothetical protein [Lactobacillus gallinarum]
MSKLKRITFSLNRKDNDLIEFFNLQQNTSLSIRLIIKKWITEYGTEDVADLLAVKSGNKDTNELDQEEHRNDLQNNQPDSSALIDDDIDDDFDDL